MTRTGTTTLRELTVRGVVLGGLITLVFTAANVYLGLKVGLTFATAIPAAVISMAVLRYFRDHSILENNIVQTIASAAGTLAAIIFVLPGLIMIGWWQGFPYWTTVAVCVIGGTLGVMYSVPLRRALVTGSDLPYPEGVAAAEVLKVGEESEEGAAGNAKSLRAIVLGSLAAAGFSLLAALKVIGNEISLAFRVGSGGSLFGASLSLALIGVGHLVGVTVGAAMIVGLLISYGVLLPALLLALLHGPSGDPNQITALVAYALFTTAVVFSVATISNDNLQDLKTGQLVGATPWKQQVALVIGVVFGALVIAPVLDLLNAAFGFAGAPGAGDNALAAPQAALISALAKGVFGGSLNWGLIGLGALIGAVVIVIDEVLSRTGTLPAAPARRGHGHVPADVADPADPDRCAAGPLLRPVGRAQGGDVELKKRLGVLMATGLIVGESLFGVVFAGIVAASGSDAPLAVVGEDFENWAIVLGVVLYVATILGLYRATRRSAEDRTG